MVFNVSDSAKLNTVELVVLDQVGQFYTPGLTIYENMVRQLTNRDDIHSRVQPHLLTKKVLHVLNYMTCLIKQVLSQNTNIVPLLYKDEVLFLTYKMQNNVQVPLFSSRLHVSKTWDNAAIEYMGNWTVGQLLYNNFLIALYAYDAHDAKVLQLKQQAIAQLAAQPVVLNHFLTLLDNLPPPKLPSSLIDIIFEQDTGKSLLHKQLSTLIHMTSVLLVKLPKAEQSVLQNVVLHQSIQVSVQYCNTLLHWYDVQKEKTKSLEHYRLLSNIGNSCYMDSVLVVLLLQPNKFVDEHILNSNLKKRAFTTCDPSRKKNFELDMRNRKRVQSELKVVAKTLRSAKHKPYYCTDFRATLKNFCPRMSTEQFYNDGQHDAKEFIGWLFELFDLQLLINKFERYITYKNGSSVYWSDIDMKDVIKSLDYDSLVDNVRLDTVLQKSSFTDPNPESAHKTLLETESIIDAPYLIISCERQGGQRVVHGEFQNMAVNTSSLIIPEYLTLQSGSQLWLSGVVVFGGGTTGGHYTAFVKINNLWYFYNDLGPVFRLVGRKGTFSELLVDPYDPRQQGVLFFYT